MISAFVDSSVLFAAALSSSGASREILRYGIRGTVDLTISDLVLEEVRRNLVAKRPKAVTLMEVLIEAVRFRVVNPSKRDVARAAQYTALKDAPIVAAAGRANVDYLVSLDRRHLVGQTVITQASGLNIVLPEELLRLIREER